MGSDESPDHTKQEEVHVQIQNQASTDETLIQKLKRRKWWISLFICAALVVIGRSLSTLLQNFYYVQTGREVCGDPNHLKGTWLQAIVQNAAFPVTAFCLLFFRSFSCGSTETRPLSLSSSSPSLGLLLLYVSLGILFAAYSELYAIGKTHTYLFPWIFLTQIIFTAIFAKFINKHKFNRWIILAIILSGVATGLATSEDAYYPCEDESYRMGRGALCALFGTVAFSLSLCIMQLGFKKVIKNADIFGIKKGFGSVLKMQVYASMIATLICFVGLFISGEHKDLKEDYNGFHKGKTLYVLSLIGLSISWQVMSVGLVGSVFFASSVFSNVVNFCASPVTYILVSLAFRFMDDEVTWLKGGALLAGILCFASYVYSLYRSMKRQNQGVNQREINDVQT
ncbi:PREDICTED: putative purine permease 20 isoform X2 [Tarenaya hassleriana]|uniref:putative purine permease 20 isoform X2 n=1 Tax=Tarenaya hassleriana TaxID=28532 RepID=UPI00053C92D5|nr:PREDICTED: putative purine permease 20 isoform X2 [Tarenaya hassleriana]